MRIAAMLAACCTGSPLMSQPSFDLLSVTYFRRDDRAEFLASLVRYVNKYHRDAGALGRRKARRADLEAAAKAGERFLAALGKLGDIDLVEAWQLELTTRDDERARTPVVSLGAPPEVLASAASIGGPGAIDAERDVQMKDVTASRTVELLGELAGLHGRVTALSRGLARQATSTAVRARGGQPQRHDALQAGLEALAFKWEQDGLGAPTMSFKEGGFGALATILFAKPTGPFEAATVEGAVVAFMRALRDRAAPSEQPASK